MKNYRWNPIEDLPEDWPRLASSELAGLLAVWREQVVRVKDSSAYQQFQARLRREWAIETGIIEGLYDIDRGVTRTLIEQGLHASLIAHGDANRPADEIIPILKDHEAVVEGLFDFIGQRRQLSTSYVKEVHQALTSHQETAKGIDALGRIIEIPLLRGDWKKRPNNPTRKNGGIHEYCPPEQVASEMDRLVEMHRQHLQEEIPPEVEAAWLHHRFTQIHPFQDGNGRVARAIASLVFLRSGWLPLVVHRDDRLDYIDSLEQADQGNLAPLVLLFSRIQKKAFNQTLRLSEEVLFDTGPIQELIHAATERLKARKEKPPEMFDLVRKLEQFTYDRFQQIAGEIDGKLKQVSERFGATVERITQPTLSTNITVMKVAEELGYDADTQTYSTLTRLSIREENLTEITLSFHTLGVTYLGIMAVSAFSNSYRDAGEGSIEDLARISTRRHLLCLEPFQFAHAEPEQKVTERFPKWLDQVLTAGVDLWHRSL
jgi:Fic family protein